MRNIHSLIALHFSFSEHNRLSTYKVLNSPTILLQLFESGASTGLLSSGPGICTACLHHTCSCLAIQSNEWDWLHRVCSCPEHLSKINHEQCTFQWNRAVKGAARFMKCRQHSFASSLVLIVCKGTSEFTQDNLLNAILCAST